MLYIYGYSEVKCLYFPMIFNTSFSFLILECDITCLAIAAGLLRSDLSDALSDAVCKMKIHLVKY